ncbi:MAG TPA: glycogen debranching N-terminal domain-containing protein, partial [Ramlibacter sp.]|nr:glycogen debranching N-terminal domain-containing protein [Ramlibacter sp.]
MSERILIGDQWYVAAKAARAEESPQVIKDGDTFALFDRFGDVHATSSEHGIYHEDTRFVSQLELTVNDVQPMFLGATVKEGNNLLIVEMMNPDLMEDDGRMLLPKGELHLFRAKLLWDGACYEHIRLSHHGRAPARIELALRFDSDFADLFEVRGAVRAQRGNLLPPQRHPDELDLGYEGLDGRRRHSRVQMDPAPRGWNGNEARYVVELAPHGEFHLYCTVRCEIDGEPPRERLDYDGAYQRNAQARARQHGERCRTTTSNPLMDLWLDRSISDLAMLTTQLPAGPYPYAGVPWYSTTFGRDGIITALEYLWVNPALARGVLTFLAANQAKDVDPQNDAEPGKILHEARKCEMARTGEVPFGRYYGTVDATPLFVSLAGAYHRRT